MTGIESLHSLGNSNDPFPLLGSSRQLKSFAFRILASGGDVTMRMNLANPGNFIPLELQCRYPPLVDDHPFHHSLIGCCVPGLFQSHFYGANARIDRDAFLSLVVVRTTDLVSFKYSYFCNLSPHSSPNLLLYLASRVICSCYFSRFHIYNLPATDIF